MSKRKKHIVIDARIRKASTGRPVARLLEHLQQIDSNHRYTILLSPDDSWRPKANNFTAKAVRYKNFSFNPINQLLYSFTLYRLKPDLVHFTLTPQQPLLYFGKQTTFTHDLVMLRFVRAERLPSWLHNIRMRGYRTLLWAAHRRSKHIMVPTEFVADDINKYHLFTNRKTTVTLEASEPPLSVDAIQPEVDPGEFIMYVGSAFLHKNLERLVSAFCLIKEEHPNLKLVLIGKREYYSKKLEKWAKKYTGEHNGFEDFYGDIIFTGFIPDEELKWYYEKARAYVFPTLSEGFGLPGLEAMVHGCPVVSSNASCLPEVHGDAAHYFEPTNIQEMAEKINDVITNEPLRKRLIKKGHENVKRFSWNKFTKQHLDIFKQVLKED